MAYKFYRYQYAAIPDRGFVKSGNLYYHTTASIDHNELKTQVKDHLKNPHLQIAIHSIEQIDQQQYEILTGKRFRN